MSLLRKSILYFNTLRYLKGTQILHRLTFRFCRPKPDLSPAPPLSELKAETAFPEMPATLVGKDRFRFLNAESAFSSWNDPAHDKLWLYNLHYFDWLRQKELPEDEGNRWIAKWTAENPPPSGNGWEPYPISLRIVNWIKWHLSGHTLTEEARHSLAVQTRFLMHRLEYHLLANHLLANAKALVFAGCFFRGPEAEKWLAKGLEIYREQLPEQILPDGGHFELSPMYHSIILEDLLDLKNIHAPLELDDCIGRMLRWLSVMTGPDGRIAFFNDAAYSIALDPAVLHAYAEKLGFERCPLPEEDILLPDSGYARLVRNGMTLIADCGEPGPSYQPGHAHADALSFELWSGTKKILTNGGTGRYYASPERAEQRSSGAHNTLRIDGVSSSEVWSAHRVARRGHPLSFGLSDGVLRGVFRTWKGFVHARTWRFEGNELIVADEIAGRGTHRLELFFQYEPGITAKDIRIRPDSALAAEETEGVVSPGFGLFIQAARLVCRGTAHLPVKLETVIGTMKES